MKLPRPRILAAALISLAAVSAQAQTFTWTQTAAGTTYEWWDNVNWGTDFDYPNGAGVIANYNINIAGAVTTRLMTPISLGTLNIGDTDGSHAYGISSGPGDNPLTFDSVAIGGDVFLNVQGTGTLSNTISTNVFINGTSTLKWNSQAQGITQTGIFNTNDNDIVITGGSANAATWTVNGDLIGNGTITYSGPGGISINNNPKSFTGTFVLNRGVSGVNNAASLTVTSGSIANVSEVVINGALAMVSGGLTQTGGGLHSGNNSGAAANPGQRLPQGAIRLNGGSLNAVGQSAQTTGTTPWTSGQELVVDNVNTLDFNSGYSFVGLGASNTTAGTRLNVTTMERGVGATAFLRGATIGGTATSRLMVANVDGFLVGGGGAEGSTTMSIVPWMAVNATGGGLSAPVSFAVHGATGMRQLLDAEHASSITAGADANVDTGNIALTAPTTINALRLSSHSAPANMGAGQVLTIASGGLFFKNNASSLGGTGALGAGTVAFGAAEGVVWSNFSNTNTIGAVIDGTAGLTKAGTGTLVLTGINTYSGRTTVSGGTLQVGDGIFASNLGLTGDVVVASGATLSLLNSGAIADTSTLTLELYGVITGRVNLGDTVNETVASLFYNDAFAAPGTYGSTLSTAMFKDDTYFSGTGMLTVVPEPASAAMLMGGIGLLLGGRRRRK